ncbi:MAG: DinB family protein [Planctomycetota bacterium]|nr:DinB family protein [Planctomycetota bacterium]
MDLLDRLLGHDAWTTKQLLDLSRGLTEAQLDREFDLGPGTLLKTLGHIVRNVEVWGALMEGMPASEIRKLISGGDSREDSGGESGGKSGGGSIEALIERHEKAASTLAKVSQEVSKRGAWDATWLDSLDDPPTEKTYGGAIAHVISHSMHHRGQALYMLRRLGVEGVPEGDVLSWENQLDS